MDRGAQVIRMLKQGTPTQDELNAALRRLILQGEGDCTDKEAEAARMLAARGADVDSLRWGREMGTALHHRMSFFSGRRRVRAPAELLLALGIDVNARDTEGQTPLHYAVREQHIRAGRDFSDDVKLLLDRGADVNAKDKSGVTALHLACRAGDDAVAAEFIDLLIARGADVNAEDAQGCTPLYAVGGPQKAKVLIEHGADVSAANSHGFTALFITRDLEVAQLLIERGADVKGRSTTGGTPLHICRSPEITQLLIDRGAEVNARDDFGETPLAVAERLLKTAPGDTVAARRQIVTILRKHGATK
jgi:ankyrin repeat protein